MNNVNTLGGCASSVLVAVSLSLLRALRRGAVIFPFLGTQWIAHAQEKGALTIEKKTPFLNFDCCVFLQSCANSTLIDALIFHLFLVL